MSKIDLLKGLVKSARSAAGALEGERYAERAAREAEELVRLRSKDTGPVATKGKSKGPSPKPERAKPKTKAEISAIAERIAPQLTGEFVRGAKGTTSVAGKSRKQFDLEQELEHDIRRSREVPEAEEISLEPYKGNVMLSLPGDTSIADYDIFSIGGEGLRAPSRQYGGPRFGLGHPEEAGWASGLEQAAGFQRRVNAASQQYGDVPVLANYLAMGPEGLNYASHYMDSLLKLTKPEQMTSQNIDVFNRIIRSGTPKKDFSDFPGIEHPEAAYLYLAQNPAARKHYNAIMQQSGMLDLGLPSGMNVRHAVTEPELRDLERGMTGFSLLEMQPGVERLKPSAHPTYSHDIPGKFVGRTDILYPYEMTFPDTVASIRANPKQAESEFGTLQMGGGKQIIDQQLLEELGEYRRRIKELTGKAEGGVVSMADGGQTFPLQRPELVTEVRSRKPKHPLAELLGKGVGAVHEFASKPFGYENPPGEMASSLLGLPAVATTLERFAYGEPLTRGSGETFGLRPETTEALMTALPVAGEAARLGAKGAKALAPTAREMLEAGLEKAVAPTKMYVMKPKGGNWMAGDVEREVTDPLKIKIVGQAPEERIALHERLLQDPELNQDQIDRVKYHLELTKNDAAINSWVDKKLNRYVKNEMGTTEDPIRLGIERRAAAADKLKAENQAKLRKMEADIGRARAAGKDTTLSQRDLEAAREKFADEQYVASQGLYHSPIPEGGWDDFDVWQPSVLESKRQEAGFPGRNMATHPAAKFWEVNSDINLSNVAAKEYQNPALQGTPLVEDNPWIQKLDPEAKINLIGQSAHVDLDFPHMIDELRNAMAPDTPLPASLRVTAKDLEKMTPDDVSALVGKINAWRNVQRTKSNAQIANNPATHLFKEYPPENNPKGVSWRQIKLPEGYPEAEARKFVKEATQYEGDMMRHCVGGAGHCEPLLRGEVEIYTLRDAKGEPHVTIEVKPADVPRAMAQLSPDERQYLVDTVKNKYFNGVMPGRSNEDEFWKMLDHEYIQVHGKPPPAILEIKGKNNNKPKDEYIPFVQDFIKSGNWSNIKDFHNTNLIHLSPSSDMAILLREAGSKNIPKYLTQEEANVLSRWAAKGGELPEGFANGGAVTMAAGGAVDYESRFNEMLQKHIGMAEGGAVDYESRFNEMLQKHIGMAEGGEVNEYNSDPDMSDGGLFVPAPAFKKGGAVKSIWKVN